MEDKLKHIVYKFLDETDFVRHNYLKYEGYYKCYNLCNQFAFRYHIDRIGKVTSLYLTNYLVRYIMKFIPINYSEMNFLIKVWIKDKYGR